MLLIKVCGLQTVWLGVCISFSRAWHKKLASPEKKAHICISQQYWLLFASIAGTVIFY